jgi:hypothetical protein
MDHKINDLSGLVDILTKAMASISETARSDDELFFLVNRIIDSEEDKDSPLGILIWQIKSEPSLKIFDNNIVTAGHGNVHVTYSHLINWLIRNAYLQGPSVTVENLVKYVSTPVLPVNLAFALSGINISNKLDLEDGINLIPFEKFLECDAKKWIRENFFRGTSYCTAVLLKATELDRTHFPIDGLATHNQPLSVMGSEDARYLEDILLCLGLFGPTAPCVLAKWVEFPSWSFVPCNSYVTPFIDCRPLPQVMPPEVTGALITLLADWRSLNKKEKERLRVPMERLSKAIRRSTHVESAIDLGIVLEALFLDDSSKDELSFRLRLRAARWLGENLASRKEIHELLGLLYDRRSLAVHTGMLPDFYKGKSTDHLLLEGFELSAKAIRRMISEGKPNWELVLLSSD